MRRLIGFVFAVIITGAIIPTFAQDATPVLVEAYRTVNVRSGPSSSDPIIGQLQRGQAVEANGRSSESGMWLRIRFNEGSGWIAIFTVAVRGDVTTLPTIAPDIPTTDVHIQALALERSSANQPFVTAYRAVNVRAAPDVDSARLGQLSPGSTAFITAVSPDGEWLQIDFNGSAGWVANFVVSVTGNLASLPVIESTINASALAAPAAENTVAITTRFNTNLRASPVLSAPIIATIPFNTRLTARARSVDQDWFLVEYNNVRGWLVASLVNVDGGADLNSLPLTNP